MNYFNLPISIYVNIIYIYELLQFTLYKCKHIYIYELLQFTCLNYYNLPIYIYM